MLIHTHRMDGYDMVAKPILRPTTTTTSHDATTSPSTTLYLLFSTGGNSALPIKQLRIDDAMPYETKGTESTIVPSLPDFEWVDVAVDDSSADRKDSSVHHPLAHRLCFKRATAEEVNDFDAMSSAASTSMSHVLSRFAVGAWVDLLDAAGASATIPNWRAAQVKANTSVTPSRLLPPQALVLLVPQFKVPHKEVVVESSQVRVRVAPLGTHTNVYLSPAYPTLRAMSMRRLLVPADIDAIHHTLDESFFDMQPSYFTSCLVPFVETCMAAPCRDAETALAMQAFLQHCIKHWVAAVLGDAGLIPPSVYPYAVVALLKLLCNGYDVCSVYYQPDGHAPHWQRLDDLEHTIYYDQVAGSNGSLRSSPCRSVYFVENVEYFFQAGGLRAILRRVKRPKAESAMQGGLVPLPELDMYLAILLHAKPILTPTETDVDGLTEFFHASFDRIHHVSPDDLQHDHERVVESVLDRIDALYTSWLDPSEDSAFVERLELTRINVAYQYLCCPALSHQLTGMNQMLEWLALAQNLDSHVSSTATGAASASAKKRIGSFQRLSSLITKTTSSFVSVAPMASTTSTPVEANAARARWLRPSVFAAWLRQANVIEHILGDPTAMPPGATARSVRDAHVEVWKRSTPLLVLLSQHGQLTEVHLTLLWHLGRKQTMRRKVVYDMLLQLAASMQIQLLDAISRLLHDTISIDEYDGLTIHFLTRITRLANGKAHSTRTAAVDLVTLNKVASMGVEFLWTAATHAPDHPMHREFVTAFANLLHEMHRIETGHDHGAGQTTNTREQYIQLCVRALASAPSMDPAQTTKSGQHVVPVELALRVLQAVMENFVPDEMDLSGVTSAVEASSIKNAIKLHPLHPFIDELETTYQLLDVVSAVLPCYVDACLAFLSFVLTKSGLMLHQTHIEALFTTMIKTLHRREAYFAWLLGVLPNCPESSTKALQAAAVVVLPDKFISNGAFTNDTVETILATQFTQCMAMDAHEFACFERLFRFVNGAIHRHLTDAHVANGFTVDVPLTDLCAYDTLLSIATTCTDATVASRAQQYIVYLLLHLSSSTLAAASGQQHTRRDVWLQFGVWCMSHVYDATSLANTNVARRLLELLAMFLFHAQPRGSSDVGGNLLLQPAPVPSEDLMVYIKMQDGRTSAPLYYTLPRSCLVAELRDRVAADVGHFAEGIRMLTDTKVKLTVQQHNMVTLEDAGVFGKPQPSNKRAYVEVIVLKKPELDTIGHKKSTTAKWMLPVDAAADWSAVAKYLTSTWLSSLLEMLEDPTVCDPVWRVLSRLPHSKSPSRSLEEILRNSSLPTLIFQLQNNPALDTLSSVVAVHVRQVLIDHATALSSAKNLLVWHGWSRIFDMLDAALQQGDHRIDWPERVATDQNLPWVVVLNNVFNIAHSILTSQTQSGVSQSCCSDTPNSFVPTIVGNATECDEFSIAYAPAPLLDREDKVCELALVHAMSLLFQLVVVVDKSSPPQAMADAFMTHPHVHAVLLAALDHPSSQVRGETVKTLQNVCNCTLNPSSWSSLFDFCMTLLATYDGQVRHGDFFYLYGDIVATLHKAIPHPVITWQPADAMARLLARLQHLTTPDETADHVLEGLLHTMLFWMKNKDARVMSENVITALIVEVFDKCLFPASTTAIVKCRSNTSRSVAFQLLLRCIDVSPKVALPLVLNRMIPQHSFDARAPKKDKLLSKVGSTSATSPKPTAQKTRGAFVGLKNLGCTCYFNTVVQMGFLFPPFQQLVLSAHCPDESSVLFQLQSLYAHLQGSSRPYVNPIGLLSVLKTNTGAPVNVKLQQDASEFLTSFLQQLEAELNNGKQGKIEAQFHRALGGVFSNELVADGDRYSERTEPFHYISVAVRDRKTLAEALDSWVEGDTVGVVCAMIVIHPPTWMLYTKEGQAALRQLHSIDASNASIEWRAPEYYQYDLSGTIIHMGTAHSGHYYAYLKDPTGAWYEFNDTVVTPFDPRHLAEECFGGLDESPTAGTTPASMKTHSAFMLVYTRRKPVLTTIPAKVSKSLSFVATSLVVAASARLKRRLQHHTATPRVNPAIWRAINAENQTFWRKQYVGDVACTTFTYDLCHDRTFDDGLTFQALQFAATYVFGTLWQCREVARMLEWKALVLSFVGGHNPQGCTWWVQTLGSHPTLLSDVFILHDQALVREFVVEVTLKAMEPCTVAQCQPMVARLLTHFRSILDCDHSYTLVLLEFAQKAPGACEFLVRHRVVDRLVCMMLTGDETAPPARDFKKQELHNPGGLAQAFLAPSPPPHVLTGNENLFKLLALLLRHVPPREEVVSADSTSAILSTTRLPVVLDEPDNILSSHGWICLLTHRANAYSAETIPWSSVITSLCWESRDFSMAWMDYVLNAIEEEDHHVLKPYFRTLRVLLSIGDSLCDERVDGGMTRLIAIMASQQKYFKATETTIDMLLRMAKRVSKVGTWLFEHQRSWSWVEKWLLTHRGVDGSLQTQKTVLTKPRSTSGWRDVATSHPALVKNVEKSIVKFVPRLRALLAAPSFSDELYDSDDDPMQLVGHRVKVKWAKEKWYMGRVATYNPATREHAVFYDDGDKKSYKMADKIFVRID
ncbi:hypothetical protein DYB32_006786 [Aphanomyces invadans]|uniref:USP domain-containing protein n=1 Tax=Aphanomyces invadans TaxID=157072 RepID=A0A418AQH9_9STRA|nr:hypothetical protein DYB32_006786 [Aphanomyces invadans]